MVTAAQSSQSGSWSRSITHTPQEFALTPLTVVSGSLPAELRGSLYRNGPGRLERGGIRVGHWFDGDGAILAVHFAAGQAIGTYRFVQTEGYQAETAAGKLLYGGYGMVPPGPLWQRFGRGLAKNVANTSVLALPEKLLALWEGGQPYHLDLETLETIGLDHLGALKNGQNYSAHPKRDPKTGEIFNFSVSFGKGAVLHLYRSDRTGTIQQQGSIPLSRFSLVHDFVLAGPYLVFCIPPVQLNPLPVLARLQSYSESMSWKPEVGTQILVVDRATLQPVSQGEAEPWFQWHFGNGWVNSTGEVELTVIRYQDFQTNQYLKEVATGQTQCCAPSTFWKLRLNPQTGTVLETQELIDRICEFPTLNPTQVDQPAQYTYVNLHRTEADPRRELFGAIARYDHQHDALMELDCGAHYYPSEPLFAPHPGKSDQGWVLAVVYNGECHRSEIWVMAADRLSDGPICRLALPEVIPMGFHGTWKGG